MFYFVLNVRYRFAEKRTLKKGTHKEIKIEILFYIYGGVSTYFVFKFSKNASINQVRHVKIQASGSSTGDSGVVM